MGRRGRCEGLLGSEAGWTDVYDRRKHWAALRGMCSICGGTIYDTIEISFCSIIRTLRGHAMVPKSRTEALYYFRLAVRGG